MPTLPLAKYSHHELGVTTHARTAARLRGGGPFRSGLQAGEQGPLLAPRDDLLSPNEARQLHYELLAGHAAPDHVPQWMCDLLAICDTGCGTSFGNTTRVMAKDSIYDEPCAVNGAAGAFTTTKKGTMKLPMETDDGNIGTYSEEHAILHEACAYSLVAIGRASREQGVSLYMPPYGEHGYFMYPSGVKVTLLNRHVLVVRPIGYKVSPHTNLQCLASAAIQDLGVPEKGLYFVYVGANEPRPNDVLSQMAGRINGTFTGVPIDIKIGGEAHNVERESVATALCVVAGDARNLGTLTSPECASFSAVHVLSDAQGKPGKVKRDINNVLGFYGPDGHLPADVASANCASRNCARILSATHRAGKPGMAETPQCRRPGTRDSLPGCELHAYMYDLPAWVELRYETRAAIVVSDQCMSADPGVEMASISPKATAWFATGALAQPVSKIFGGLRCSHWGQHISLRGLDSAGTYVTRGSECYSSTTATLIVDAFMSVH